MALKLRKLRVLGKNWWHFEIYFENRNRMVCYMTNKAGEGLFDDYNFYGQYIGTCDFSLRGKSVEAARKYIKRLMDKGVFGEDYFD